MFAAGIRSASGPEVLSQASMSYSYPVCPSRVQFNDVHATLIRLKLPAAGGSVPFAAAVALSIAALAASGAGAGRQKSKATGYASLAGTTVSAFGPGAGAWKPDDQSGPSRLVEKGTSATTRTPKADGSLTSSTSAT